ncbi:MAG: nitrogen fixation protein NifX [Pseudanabaenales cyanobacterium]|nr:nitrogen fixation protein NifX [Pseudanabaenales cyanobacterium]
MKIAFATRDSVHINAHFGSAQKVDVYDVTSAGYEFLETIEFSGNLKEDGNEDKLTPKVAALDDCTIVYVAAIGGSAAKRLLDVKVTPLRAESEDDLITDVLGKLVKMLQGSPPPWLRKALRQRSTSFAENSSSFVEDSFAENIDELEEEEILV